VTASTPAVAVVTRTKDRGLLLDRAVRSVLQQTFDDLELMIVNDGGDPEPVEEVVARYRWMAKGRVRVLHNPTSTGMEAASNLGLRSTTSTYVAIHDDDDTWHPRFLERALGVMKRSGLRGAVTGVQMIHEEVDRGDIRLRGSSAFESRPERNREDPTLLAMEAANGTTLVIESDELDGDQRTVLPPNSLYRLLESNLYPPIAFVYERSVFDEIGYYDEDLPPLADWDFNIRFLSAFDIAFLPRVLAYYHQRSGTGPMANSVIQANLHNQTRQRILNTYLRSDLSARQLGPGYLANRLNDDRIHRISQQSTIDGVWGGVYHAQTTIDEVERTAVRLLQTFHSLRLKTYPFRHPVLATKEKVTPDRNPASRRMSDALLRFWPGPPPENRRP
jgi:glycosyltransferase involved in cell wall biosynthesis